ncbi:hypothetical protein MHTCC0001_14230 [Flavobacteriaceae bacterium MHTCC 0001]
MEADAAQYASISMEMYFNKSYLHVFERGKDYLDKPPLLFWLSSISYMLFGISNFAYKLPSVLILILGIYSTYRFTLLWYNKEKAILAAFIVATTQAFFQMSNDIRTDTAFSGFVIFSVWQICIYLKTSTYKHLLLGALGVGCAMLTKGPLGLIIPVVAFSTDFALKRQWRNFFKPQWIIMLFVVALILLPMSYGLYTQFDLHPEKTAYGIESPSGLRFYYWTQSFGRITGENYWQNNTSFFYFFHTILWDFQPWVLFLIPALIAKLSELWQHKFKIPENKEYISGATFIIVLLMLSKSNYKLPHYIFPLFSFASVFVSNYIVNLAYKGKKMLSRVQFGIMNLFAVLIIPYYFFVFPPKHTILPIISAVLFIGIWLLFLRMKEGTDKIVLPTLGIIFIFNLTMASEFYPNLLRYQSSIKAGKYIMDNNVPRDKFYIYDGGSYALDFYAKRNSTPVTLENIESLPSGAYLYVDYKGYEQLVQRTDLEIVEAIDHYRVTALTGKFLNKKTRHKKLKTSYLLKKK